MYQITIISKPSPIHTCRFAPQNDPSHRYFPALVTKDSLASQQGR